ncbi:MAG: hypothetical protein M1480_11590 [Bacteroidetes bacterium]|nr:hypothetical protein [Bacteroidota bacterium]
MSGKYFLHDNWKFKLFKKEDASKVPNKILKFSKWLKAEVPGTVQTDLLKAELIPDPFYSDNEIKLQWIGELDWHYQTSFNLPKNFSLNKKIYLIFESLDTIAEIILNDKVIDKTKNIFLEFKFEVSKLLKKKNNKLEVIFTSAEKYAEAEENKYGKLPVALRSERVYIRKAQYSFGWDWGPAFLTMGISQPVFLFQPNEIHIEDFSFETLSIGDKSANIRIKFSADEPFSSRMKIKIIIKGSDQKIEYDEVSPVGLTEFVNEYEIKDPKLWWPNGYGESHLYDLEIKIEEKNIVLDELKKKIGIRTIKLDLFENDKPTFRFIINNKPIFFKGANWIPADSFLPRVKEDKYRKLLLMASKANMNVIRVWGGGSYERNIFYDICDELGLIVWQDFMFACASYPENEEFLNNVKTEVEQNVKRLQHHPSIAIWCGNNENEWIWYQEQKKSYKEMPGYKIYHELIPEILKKLDPLKPYWPSTPFSNEEDPNSPLSGNRHQWAMWSWWVDYKKVRDDNSLFVTEFGFQSSANYKTILSVLPKDQQYTQSRIFEFHNKQVEGPERLFKFLSGHLPIKMELRDFVYLTQLNQGLALKECVEHWQFRFPQSNGSIIWQLNDCWPVASWALIDSSLIPKLSYYMVQESFSNILISTSKDGEVLKILVQNNSLNQFTGYIQIDYVNLITGKVNKISRKKIIVDSLLRQESNSLAVSNEIENGKGLFVISLRDTENKIVNRNYFAGMEFKYLKMVQPKIKIKFVEKENIIKVSTDKPAFFVFIECEDLMFEKNGVIILPDEKISIRYTGLVRNSKKEPKIFCTTLNQYLQ